MNAGADLAVLLALIGLVLIIVDIIERGRKNP